MHRRLLHAALAVSAASLLLLSNSVLAQDKPLFNSSTFGGLSARAIGPAKMSGRIAALDAVAEDPLTIYVGAASGGVWKSIDAGTTFSPVFDEHTQSIGAIKIDPSDPEIVWVGTGESWVRNSVSVGTGVYKSTDGGDTWKHVGLAGTERIGAIRVDPNDGDIVYVAALGTLWGPNDERGVYRTRDGGETWERVLFVDENTGCADLDIDPHAPSIVYATMWEHRRGPDFFNSGGPGSGLFRSLDGGDSWQELTEGLPAGDKGRICVAVAPSRPSTVYSIVESEKTALYRSDDLGGHWREMNSSGNVQSRPFYFSELLVDPNDHERVYKPAFSLTISTDGGKTFSSIFRPGFNFGGVHPDHHAMWINPNNSDEVLLGTDGGFYMSNDGAHFFRHAQTLPISQFYRVSVDMEMPYNVYGGLQDNGSWKGPSRSSGGIFGSDWRLIGFGDGFWAFADPNDAQTVYVEYQGGRISRVDLELGEAKSIPPYATGEQEKLRFNWNAPIHISPNDPSTLYFGSQYVHRTRDRGDSWETISPDLTTDDPQRQRQEESGGITTDNSTAENNTTIYSICESPKDAQTIWVGTDDGYVQLTRDGGKSWNNVTRGIPGLPEGLWVSCVQASPHDAATAFVTVDGHRSGDKTPYVYRTDDHGQSWRSLVTDGIEGYAHAIRQDLVNPELLFLGTEFGLYVSLDAGAHWARFKENLPKVAVRDIAIHPRDHDVVLATHGRGVYILDDITSLRSLTREILEQDVALIETRPSTMFDGGDFSWFPSDDQFVGQNPPEVATITYYLKKRHLFGDLKLEIFDHEGELITTLPARKRPGLNRIEWPMRLKAPKVPPATALVPAFQGPRVPEGEYRVVLTKGKTQVEGTVSLVPDPRSKHSAEDRALQQKSARQLYDLLADLTFLSDQIAGLQERARTLASEQDGSIAKKLTAFADDLEQRRKSLVVTSKAGMLSGQEKLREKLGELYGAVNDYAGRPTESQLSEAEKLVDQLAVALSDFDAFASEDLAKLNRDLQKKDVAAIELMSREAWEAEEEGSSPAGAKPKHVAGQIPEVVRWLSLGF